MFITHFYRHSRAAGIKKLTFSEFHAKEIGGIEMVCHFELRGGLLEADALKLVNKWNRDSMTLDLKYWI